VHATATFVARADGVLAGTACATEAFAQVDASLTVTWTADDGDRVAPGARLGTVAGPLTPMLTAERTALNFLGHLSGVATLVSKFVDRANGAIRVWDTRKTTPGLRALEKAAVRAGGGRNHRGNLSDWVMLKDNHLMGVGITKGVALAKDRWPGRTVHVEAERLDQVIEAVDAGALHGMRSALVQPEHGLRVAGIDGEEHQDRFTSSERRMSSPMSSTGAELVIDPDDTKSAPVDA
jgi:nicotinate-nucleotide pyrophosphorylase (carboxylating)